MTDGVTVAERDGCERVPVAEEVPLNAALPDDVCVGEQDVVPVVEGDCVLLLEDDADCEPLPDDEIDEVREEECVDWEVCVEEEVAGWLWEGVPVSEEVDVRGGVRVIDEVDVGGDVGVEVTLPEAEDVGGGVREAEELALVVEDAVGGGVGVDDGVMRDRMLRPWYVKLATPPPAASQEEKTVARMPLDITWEGMSCVTLASR